jgi:hypothetical protein
MRPATTKGERLDLPTADQIDYFDPVARSHHRVDKRPSPDDLQIVLDGHPPRIDGKAVEQLDERERFRQLVGFAVDDDEHVA